MKKAILVAFLISIVSSSCVMEPGAVFYHFIVKNETKKTVLITIETIEDSKFSVDTVNSSRQIEREIVHIGCYKDYGDSLIKYFFKEFNIKTEAEINLDLYNRKNWIDSTELSGLICKGGNAFFILELKESDFK